MQVVKDGISDVGLSRILVNKGKSDVTFLIEKEFIKSVGDILTSMNPYFETIIQDCSINNVVTFPIYITKASFFELEKYYSGGIIKITFNNVYELLEICNFVKDDNLLGICSKYIENKITSETYVEVLNNFTSLQLQTKQKLKILNDGLQTFFSENIRLIQKNFLSFTPQSIIYIFQIPTIKLPPESHMIHLLISYFINSKTDHTKIKNYKVRLLQCFANYYPYCSFRLLSIRNTDFRDVIMLKLYRIKEKVAELNDEDKKILQNININKEIEKYTSCGVSSLYITLILIIVLYEMKQMKPQSAPINDAYLNCLYEVYKNKETTNVLKNSIAKLLSIHIIYGEKNSFYEIINKFNSDEFLYRLLLFSQVLDSNFIQLIIDRISFYNENLIKSISMDNLKISEEIINEINRTKQVINVEEEDAVTETDSSDDSVKAVSSDEERIVLNKPAIMKLKEKKERRRKTRRSRRKIETESHVQKFLKIDTASNSSYDSDFVYTPRDNGIEEDNKNNLFSTQLQSHQNPLQQQSKPQPIQSQQKIEDRDVKPLSAQEKQQQQQQQPLKQKLPVKQSMEKENESFQLQKIQPQQQKQEIQSEEKQQTIEEEVKQDGDDKKEKEKEIMQIKSEMKVEVSPQSIIPPPEVQEITDEIKNVNLLLKHIYNLLKDEKELKAVFDIEKDSDNDNFLLLPDIYRKMNNFCYTSYDQYFSDLLDLYKYITFKKCDKTNSDSIKYIYQHSIEVVDMYKDQPTVFQHPEQQQQDNTSSSSLATKRNKSEEMKVNIKPEDYPIKLESDEYTVSVVSGSIVKRKREEPKDQLNNIFYSVLSQVIVNNKQQLLDVLHEPDLSIYPLFPLVVKNPIYISTIKERIEKRFYTRSDRFYHDFIKLEGVYLFFSKSNKAEDEFNEIYTELKNILDEHEEIKDLEQIINNGVVLEAPQKHAKLNDSVDSQESDKP